MKVFVIGMYKTGTTSLGKALQMLGFKIHLGTWVIGDGNNWDAETGKWKEFYPQIKEKVSQFDAFQDMPWMFLYKEMNEWYPESKFILTLRKDSETIAKSDYNYHLQAGVKPEDIPSKEKFIKRYENHNRNVFNYFNGKSNFTTMCLEYGDGWNKLCSFLGINQIPKQTFPHVNKGKLK